MPFLKLDVDILDSSLWVARDHRSMFLTALLMADPYQLTRPAEALDVETMKPTGFIVPAGNYGFVRAAPSAIVRTDGYTGPDGLGILRELGEPDRDSRSSDFDGRRIVRIDGGFIVLNYWRYRQKDHTAAERMRRMRERDREDEEKIVTRNVTVPAVTERNVTQYASASASSSGSDLKEKELDNREVREAVAEFAESYDFGMFGKDVLGLLRSQRNPISVIGILVRHLEGMDVPKRTPKEVGLAVQEYNASGELHFKANFFAGFLRKAPETAQRLNGRAAQEREAAYIGGEELAKRDREQEEQEGDALLASFQAHYPTRYAELLTRAEGQVPGSGPLRSMAVQGLLLNLIRREPRDASAE